MTSKFVGLGHRAEGLIKTKPTGEKMGSLGGGAKAFWGELRDEKDGGKKKRVRTQIAGHRDAGDQRVIAIHSACNKGISWSPRGSQEKGRVNKDVGLKKSRSSLSRAISRTRRL